MRGFLRAMLLLLVSGSTPLLAGADAAPAYEPASGVSGTLTSIGSDTLGGMMKSWQEAFALRYPGVILEYEGKGSGTAPIALVRGTAELGLMSRPMLPGEMRRFVSRFGHEATRIVVARDELAVFVHKRNPVEAINFSQLDALFSATRSCGARRAITTWGALGLSQDWADRGVSLYGRSAASGTYASFKRLALCRGDFGQRVNELAGGAAVIEAVARDPAGIGYGPIGLVDGRVKKLTLLRDGAGFDAGARPLERELAAYVNRGPGEPFDRLVREFLLFVLSREGQEIVEAAGYVPLEEAEIARQRALLRSFAMPEPRVP